MVVIEMHSPRMKVYPSSVTGRLSSQIASTEFIIQPNDDCEYGFQHILITVSDEKTKQQYLSESFPVKVMDFAFDHVSRPLLARVSSIALGISSVAAFILTLLEQVDTAFGWSAGVAAAIVALGTQMVVHRLFRSPRVEVTRE
jgi:hypothetical protein